MGGFVGAEDCLVFKNVFSRVVSSNTAASSHMWLFKLKFNLI